VAEDYQTIVTELEAYAEALGDKARVVALNKCDALDGDTIKKRKKALEKASGGPVMTISGVAGMGLQDTLRALHAHIKYQAPVVDDAPWQP
jgi:GTP-binding protein